MLRIQFCDFNARCDAQSQRAQAGRLAGSGAVKAARRLAGSGAVGGADDGSALLLATLARGCWSLAVLQRGWLGPGTLARGAQARGGRRTGVVDEEAPLRMLPRCEHLAQVHA